MDVPWSSLGATQRRLVLEGDGDWDAGLFPGVLGWFRWLETRAYKLHVRVLLARYRSYDPCPACHGQRLNPEALLYRVDGLTLPEWHALEVKAAYARLAGLPTRTGQGALARRELASRLAYLDRVGLGYLTLDRQARTLSGGEAQRVTLTAALGTSLHNALFVLDEPTVGLHPTDIEPLNGIMRDLARRGNTVLVVEHDPVVVHAADRVLRLGPGAGQQGGCLVFDGPPAALENEMGPSAAALAPRDRLPAAPVSPRGWLRVRGASENNLNDIDVELPLGVLCAITGPSGSGKSTLAVDIVYRALARRFGQLDVAPPGLHQRLEGAEQLRRVSLVDQAPLGRTSRGNAATYTKAWDVIRRRFATEPAAMARQLSPAHFSFNVAGGRCEACAGEGFETVEMQFLADVRLVCPSCRGARFTERVLQVTHRGVSIAQLLERSVDQVLDLFADEPLVTRALGPVARLGLGYLRLGQPLSTLSGGEAQRLKLARALGDRHAGTLFVLDEPSAGLHASEIAKLLEALRLIISAGGSVLVVEHDLGVVRAADWIVDLGPGAGVSGGRIVGVGTPAELALLDTRTGKALRRSGQAPSVVAARPPAARRAALSVTRAREHNLREVSVSIPHGALTVVTGPSGSGKSSLAFDVVFAEGQRRFLETLTPYARQFLPMMPRPDADAVVGVPPSIALEQRTARTGPQSTVATVTEVAHYLRLLFAKLGVVHCPRHDLPIRVVSTEQVVDAVRRQRGRVGLVAPAVRARKGTYLDLFTAAARAGITQAICDGELVSTDDPPRLVRSRQHSIDLVIASDVVARRIGRDAVEQALRWGAGTLKLRLPAGGERVLSAGGACPECGFSAPELDPRWFSFNTAQGRCERCAGTGRLVEVRRHRRHRWAERRSFTGVCPECQGSRLAPLPRHVRLQGERYHEFTARSVQRAWRRVAAWRYRGAERLIAQPIVLELERRLAFLLDVGLGYISLDRGAHTLSGGELQRLRLGAQLGAGLTGALYVLDEPTIGLHPRDTGLLLDNLRRLVGLSSTVIVVEHDEQTIRAADHLIDLGPGGGASGGTVVAAGSPASVLGHPDSPTGRALSGPVPLREPLSVPRAIRWLELDGARANNLRDVRLRVPVERFTVVAGVSGSGKSTLVREVLLRALRRKLGLATEQPGAHRELRGYALVRRASAVDQSPIGRTPRSVPATFLGIWDAVRALFAALPESSVAGFDASRFSFNTPAGGRCPTCEGQGVITHEMSFLPDVVSRCPACEHRRFEPRTLEIRYAGLSIGDVLALTAEEAAQVFARHRRIAEPLRTLTDLGAGYITLGQGSHTLSGGEAQRLKLAAELTASVRHEPTLYVLDEPTTGLHLTDVTRLMDVLGRLVARGDTLVVIEHHPSVIAGADWVVELGPGGGEHGGRIVASGPPRTVARRKTATAAVLRRLFGM
jgi:excinuclease ABC subunit A